MKSVHFGDRPNTLPHEDRTQRKEVEREGGKEVQRRGRVEGGEGRRGGKGEAWREGGKREEYREGRDAEREDHQ